MKISLRTSIVFVVIACLAFAKEDYFPKGTFSSNQAYDKSSAQRYSKYLAAFREPSLYKLSQLPSAHSYRFLWLRTFHHPVSVRVEIGRDGIGLVTTKVTDGAGGYSPGRMKLNRTRRLTKQQTDWLLERINALGFWSLAVHEAPGGFDGAQWVIEGVKDGKYHVVDRWSPKSGAVRSLGLDMAIDLGRLKMAAKDIY